MTDLHVLLVSHSCSPTGGSEARMTWQVANSLTRAGIRTTSLVNRVDPTAPIDPRTAPLDDDIQQLPASRHPKFVAVEPGHLSHRFPVVLYTAVDYQVWQRNALKKAREIHAADPVDVVHHLSWASIHHGTKLGSLGPPMILGPVGGGTKAPPAYASVFKTSWRYEQIRNRMVDLARFNPVTRATVGNADLIFATNPETQDALATMGMHDVELMLDDAIPKDEIPTSPPRQPVSGPLRILWISRVMERKALGMALDAIELVGNRAQVELTVVGDGESRPLVNEQMDRLTAAGLVVDHGWSDQAVIDQALANSHIMLFNSVRDNGSAPLHQAMKFGLPAVVLDHQGPGTITDSSWAVKLPLTNEAQSAHDIADALVELANNPDRRAEMGHAALKAAQGNTWDLRAQRLSDVYHRLVSQRGG